MSRSLRIRWTRCCALALLCACTAPRPWVATDPVVAQISSTRVALWDLPAPYQPIPVAVYGFTDQTGQYKPTETVQTFSRAVSQGATSVLIQALRDAGKRRWFTVLERERLDNLLKERQVISEMRQRYLGEAQVNPDALPSMLFAGILLEGGVIGYDSNTVTGGVGARFLGIGSGMQYRQDTITVYLRAVATKTGEILASVVTRKTVASSGIDGGAFRFVSFRELLEAETGVTMNEPCLIALEQAIEKSVHDLVLAGVESGTWGFADDSAGNELLRRYWTEQGFTVPDATAAAKAAHTDPPAPVASPPPRRREVVIGPASADSESEPTLQHDERIIR
jgi:curli production assembly/transport component CsgG